MISHDLWTMGIPILEKAIRTVAVYGGIAMLLRVAGKRDLAQLNTFDFVVMILLSNVVQNAIIGADNSLEGGLIGAAILLAANSVVVRSIVSNKAFGRVVEGTPTVVVRAGKYDQEALTKVGLRQVDVDVALRRQNANDVSQVREAVLEPNGAIVVNVMETEQSATKSDLTELEARIMARLDRLATT